MKSVGTQLREARQSRGWTVKAAAKATKLREDQIQKLEADDFEKFHAPTYVRGFVRNYAAVLGLDVLQISDELEQVLEMDCEVAYLRLSGVNYVPELAKQQAQFDPRKFFLVLVGIVLVGILTVFGYSVYRVAKNMDLFGDSSSSAVSSSAVVSQEKPPTHVGHATNEAKLSDPSVGSASTTEVKRATLADPGGPTTKAVKTDTSAPVSPPPETPAVPLSPQENKLALMAREECWVRVSVLDNNQTKIVLEELIPAGKTETFPPAPKYLLKARNPSALEITLNGKSYANPYANPHSTEQVPVEFSVPSSETN